MTDEMYEAFDAIEEAITLLVSVRDVINLNTLSYDEIVKLIDAMVNLFSEKQKIVWEQYRAEQESTEVEKEYNTPEFAKHYRQLTKDYIDLETKYKKLALYDTRDQHIEDLTNENTELLRKNEELQKKLDDVWSLDNRNEQLESATKTILDLKGQIRELTIEKEYYRDQYNQLIDKYERLESSYARMEEDYNNFVNTVRTVSQHPSHD